MGMNSSNFDQLFTDDFAKAKVADLSNWPIEKVKQFKEMSRVDPRAANKIVEEMQELIPNNFSVKIQNFIKRKRMDGIKDERIKRLVKKKFNITVV